MTHQDPIVLKTDLNVASRPEPTEADTKRMMLEELTLTRILFLERILKGCRDSLHD